MQTITARRLRWIAPFVAGAAIAAAAILPGVAVGSDHPSLAPRSAAQLLADLAQVKPPALSGTVVETARLGLPELPDVGGSAAQISLTNLVTGSHTARVWLDGPDRQRFALVGDLAESDVVHDGKDVWIYTSSANRATHVTIPADVQDSAKKAIAPSSMPTPAQVAADVLAAMSPTTEVTVDATARVAGRPAYQLVLSPKDSHALITSVTIALDSQTSVPLRVQVYGRDTVTPAFETGFTDVTFAAPPASVFHFIPPTGAQVVQSTPGELAGMLTDPGGLNDRVYPRPAGSKVAPTSPGQSQPTTRAGAGRTGTRTIGSGWTAVLVTDGSALSDAGSGNPTLSVLLRSATKVPQGQLITTALVSVLIADDGHVYVGAVDGAALQQVAATGQPA
jgi:outer membrane lipoprotein-sorting protein